MQLGEGAAQLAGEPRTRRGRGERTLAAVAARPFAAVDHAPHLEPAVGGDVLDRGHREAADPPAEKVKECPLARQACHPLGIIGEERDTSRAHV